MSVQHPIPTLSHYSQMDNHFNKLFEGLVEQSHPDNQHDQGKITKLNTLYTELEGKLIELIMDDSQKHNNSGIGA